MIFSYFYYIILPLVWIVPIVFLCSSACCVSSIRRRLQARVSNRTFADHLSTVEKAALSRSAWIRKTRLRRLTCVVKLTPFTITCEPMSRCDHVRHMLEPLRRYAPLMRGSNDSSTVLDAVLSLSEFGKCVCTVHVIDPDGERREIREKCELSHGDDIVLVEMFHARWNDDSNICDQN